MKKKCLLIIALIISAGSFSQIGNFVTNAEYDYKKANGTLIGDEIIITDEMINPNSVADAIHITADFQLEKSTNCTGYFSPPGTPYNISWGADDGSGPVINLPFTYCFFGDSKTQVYMNNNGNISFGSPLGTYSSSAFPSSGNQMIAAFWADFDFGSCGQMFATVTPTAAIFNWVGAGYFNDECDKLNTCQIVITNGSDPILPFGNTAIYYDDMNWTTGSASSGTNGFGGTPGTAGANRGNNIDYFQIGRFDHAGTSYDGPGGLTDGIDFLDYKSYRFDFCTVGGNLAPVALNSQDCDTIKVCHIGDTLDISFPFIGPEVNQLTTVSLTSTTLGAMTVLSNTVGYTGQMDVRIIGAMEAIGIYEIQVSATDNAVPPIITNKIYYVEVTDAALAFPVEPVISFTPGCAPVTISVSNSTFNSFSWSNNGSTSSSTTISTSFNDSLHVIVENGGCKMILDTLLNIPGVPYFNLEGSLFFCPDNLTTQLDLPDSLALDSVHWVLNSTSTLVSTDFSPSLGAGTYTATIWSQMSLCSSDTTFTISSQPNLVLTTDKVTCVPSITLLGNTGGIGAGSWTVLGSPVPSPTFSSNNLNPTLTFSGYGIFSLIYTENGCSDSDTIVVNWAAKPTFGIISDFFVCPGMIEHISIKDSINMLSNSWGINPPSADTLFSTNINAGTYNVHLVNVNGCANDTSFTVTSQPPVVLNYSPAVCYDTMEMNFNVGPSLVGQWTYIPPNSSSSAVFRNIDSLNTGIKINGYGTYQFIFTESSACQDDDTLTVTFTPGVYFNLEDTLKLCQGSVVTLVPEIFLPQFVTSMLWSTNDMTPTIDVTKKGYYVFTISNSCETMIDSVYIAEKVCDIEMPNVFSPNGDGINDLYHIKGDDEIFKEFHIVIVNRWGNIVKQYEDPTGTWDGTDASGNYVNAGVYFYKVDSVTLQDEVLVKEGFIHVVY